MMRILSMMKTDEGGEMNNDDGRNGFDSRGLGGSAKTPIVSPWTQEPNLSRFILMTSVKITMKIKAFLNV